MYCGKCGAEIKDDAKFCPKCGAATKNAAALNLIKEENIEVAKSFNDSVNSLSPVRETNNSNGKKESFKKGRNWYDSFLSRM